jgi:hypothetical protein
VLIFYLVFRLFKRNIFKYGVVGLLALISALLLYEFNFHHHHGFKNLAWQYPAKPNIVSYQTITLAINGAQYNAIASFASAEGSAPWENKSRYTPETQFNIHSNVYGFFTKYPVTAYPKKKPHEFRIILIGGSGAQGNGATRNEKMFYSLLEKKLNAHLSIPGLSVELINLASPGQYMASNELLLHYLGQALKPDMILMYNGANDIIQPVSAGFMPAICAPYVSGYLAAPYEYPTVFLKILSQNFPLLFHVHGWGPWIKKTFYSKYYAEKGLNDCLKYAGYKYPFEARASFEEVSYPSILNSMKAIKRDFCGIPIVFALQAIHDKEEVFYESQLHKGVYQELYTRLSKDLSHYYNRAWYFINVHELANALYKEKYDPELRYDSIAVHLDDVGQEIVATILADKLQPIIEQQARNKTTRLC